MPAPIVGFVKFPTTDEIAGPRSHWYRGKVGPPGVWLPFWQATGSTEPQRHGVSCPSAAHPELKMLSSVLRHTCFCVPPGATSASHAAGSVPLTPSQTPPICAGSKHPLSVAHWRQSPPREVKHSCVLLLIPQPTGGATQ